MEMKLKAQVEHLAAQLDRAVKGRSGDRAKSVEDKLSTRIDALERSLQEDVDQIKKEYQSGELELLHTVLCSIPAHANLPIQSQILSIGSSVQFIIGTETLYLQADEMQACVVLVQFFQSSHKNIKRAINVCVF